MLLENPLWHYALELYGRPGVESACLALQQAGLSINRLLFCCWLASEGRQLRPDALDASAATDWQRELTSPLRELRYRVRAEKMTEPQLEGLYRALRQAELAAEQVELAQLFDLGRSWPVQRAQTAMLLLENIGRYLSAAGAADSPQFRTALEGLLTSADPRLDKTAVRRLRW